MPQQLQRAPWSAPEETALLRSTRSKLPFSAQRNCLPAKERRAAEMWRGCSGLQKAAVSAEFKDHAERTPTVGKGDGKTKECRKRERRGKLSLHRDFARQHPCVCAESCLTSMLCEIAHQTHRLLWEDRSMEPGWNTFVDRMSLVRERSALASRLHATASRSREHDNHAAGRIPTSSQRKRARRGQAFVKDCLTELTLAPFPRSQEHQHA